MYLLVRLLQKVKAEDKPCETWPITHAKPLDARLHYFMGNSRYVIHRAELYLGIEMEKQMNIQQVSDQLGLPKSTLRYWEKEFSGTIVPARTAGGQRRYSEADVEIFACICRYKKSGYSLARIKEEILNNPVQHNNFASLEIDQLASRIANTVKREICMFLGQGPDGLDGHRTNESQNE
jgi:DNA-binding transcriptional MerR regulator